MLSRRQIVAAGLLLATTGIVRATSAGQLRVRPEAGSPRGRDMLLKYREAVRQMSDEQHFPRHDPRSWKFQANIHWTHPEDDSPEAQDAIFSTAGLSSGEAQIVLDHRQLALGTSKSVWSTCQHTRFEEHFFLAWHRLYLWHFEQIVCSIVGDDFALPYWDYSQDNPEYRHAMPTSFREAINGSVTNNPLWYQHRDADMNKQNSPAELDPFDYDATVAFGTDGLYLPDAVHGFNRQLDTQPHGQIHGRLGASGGPDPGMGNVPTAARDPIFWLHHCNIDRLWEVWRQTAKGIADEKSFSSDWQSISFTFADRSGRASTKTAADALDLGALGYAYELVKPVIGSSVLVANQTGPTSSSIAATSSETQPTTIVGNGGLIRMSVSADFSFQAVTTSAGGGPMAARLELSDVRASASPGDTFNVFIVTPQRKDEPGREIAVGRVTLFGASTRSELEPMNFTLDASAALADLTSLDQSSDFAVAIRPLRGPTTVPFSVGAARLLVRRGRAGELK